MMPKQREYKVSVANHFMAESIEDAVRQMISWVHDEADFTMYTVSDPDGKYPDVQVDAEKLY